MQNKLFYLLLLMFFLSQNVWCQDVNRSGADSKSINLDETKVYDIVEQMPSFKGGDAALMEWLSRNIKYPVMAEENGIQGRVVATFVVERDGSITNVKIVKSVESSLDNEAVRVLMSMPKWIPGKQSGQDVRVRYTVPVTFRLVEEKKTGRDSLVVNELVVPAVPEGGAEAKMYDVVEQMPQFPGGPAELMKFLGQNVRYPEEAHKNNIQGRVIVTFIVEKDGSISQAHVAKSVDPLLDAEALRVVNSMPNWIPGRQNGEPVRVKYTVPITFKLQGDAKTDPADIDSVRVEKAKDGRSNDRVIIKMKKKN